MSRRLARDVFETALSASAKRRTIWTRKKGGGGYWRKQTQKEADDEAAGLKQWVDDSNADPRSLKPSDIPNYAALKRIVGTGSAAVVGAAGVAKYGMEEHPARRKK